MKKIKVKTVPTLLEVYANKRVTFHKETFIHGTDNRKKDISRKMCRKKIKVK